MGMFTRLIFHLNPDCSLWPEQLLKITEEKNEILLKFIRHNCPSIHRVMVMLSQSETKDNSSHPNGLNPEDITIRFSVNLEEKHIIPINDLYIQKLSFDLRNQNFHEFIVEYFIDRNKLQLFQKRPTAQNIITFINNQQYKTDRTRPSDSAKNEILKRLRIN